MATMQAVRIHRFGGPECLQIDEVPIPEPGAAELLVRVHAASVNPVDYKTRQDKFPPVRRRSCRSPWAATCPAPSRRMAPT
jgi:NADPH:quinone reductase-like Zn-dependent oxidoreductase